MRKLKLFFACLPMAVLSIGQMWAADVTYSLTPDATSTGSSATSYQASLSFTYEGVSWTMAQINPSTLQTKTNQSSATAEFNFHNTSAFPGRITQVVVKYKALTIATGKQSEFMFLGGTSAVTATTGGTSGTWNSTDKTFTWTPAANTNYTYFAYYMNGKTATGSNYLAEADAIVVTYDDGQGGGSDPVAVTGVTLDQSEAEVAVGKTITLTPTVAPSNATTKTVTWESDDEDVATVDGGVVTGVAEGTATITVKTTDGNKTATCEVTVTTAPAAVNYEKVTAEPADWSGEYLLVYEADATNARVWKGADQANYYAEAAISNGVIAAPDDAAVLTIAKVAESDPVVYTIMVGDKYIGQTSDANGIKIQTTAINNSISYNGTDAAVDIVASSAHLRYNSASSSYFRYYKSATYSSQKKIQLYKKVDGSVKPAAGLAYAEADQKKLVKLGEAFTAPTLQNPNSLAVTYASNNTDVAEVAANGAVTIKAAGVAVITASFAGNDDYKAGDASYTIGVTSHAGTQADPYVAADVKIVIDAVETLENAYATGIVSNVVTTELPSEGYITFYFSADGLTSGQQIEAYKCYGLNSAQFEAVTDVKTGATVVITGTLKKYNSTYEFDANCHLVSYEAPAVPKTHIANDQANPYTVAQAITFAADGVTYDLDDYVYVQGVVYDVKSFSEGVMNIFIKDANAENQFELYKCAGINDGNATTPFEALTDVQAGNIVIGYGQLTVYNTTYEFKQGNYLVDIQKPATGIELDATAEVEAGSTVNLTATILPSNATGTIVWSVESGDDYASVENGVVTGIAEGEAVIRATVQGTEIYAECTVTVSAAAPVLTDYYEKVTETAGITDGTYLIVYEGDNNHTPVAFNGALETLEAVGNNIPVTITNDKKIAVTESTEASTFFIDVTAGSIQSASGKYIGANSYGNRLDQSEEASTYVNALSIDDDGNAVITISNSSWDGDLTLRYNYGTNNGERFRYYKNGQQPIALYKLANETVKANPELAWSGDVEITLGETFTAPTLDNPHSVEGITYASDNETLATVTDAGVIELVADATGTAHITASFAGNDDYKAVNVSCTITVNAATPTPAETKNVVILAEYNSKFYAMTNSLASGALAAVEVEKDGDKIVVFAEADKAAIQWTMTDNTTTATFQDADDKYLAHTGTGTSLALQDAAEDWTWDTDGYYYAVENRTFFYNNSGVFKNYSTSNLPADKTDYSGAPEIIEIAAENIILSQKADAELAYDPAEVTLTVGGEFTPAALTYAEGFDGLAAVTYASSNEAVATVDENSGVVSLEENATGTATITATFAGNNNYLAGSASYVITVNEAGDDLTGTWVLASSVVAGDKIIIVGSYNNKTMAMGKQNTNNRAAVPSSVDEWNVLTPGAGTKVFTLVDAGEGLFAIQASNGKYLNAAGTGSSNYMREADDYEAASAKWTISFDENGANIVATSTDNRNVIRYNSTNNSELFSCYAAGGQRAINIFKIGTPDYGSYQRNVTNGYYGTICLPKAGVISGATLFEIANYENNTIYIDEILSGELVAGRPYIFQATADQLTVTYTSATVVNEAGNANGLYGFYDLTDEDAKENLVQDAGNYILYQNAYWLVSGRAAYIANYRAYIKIGQINNTGNQAPGRRRVAMTVHNEQTTTDIDALNASETPVKMIIDGQLFIIRGEKMYNVNGQVVK